MRVLHACTHTHTHTCTHTHTHTHTHVHTHTPLPCCPQLLLRHGANHELKDEDGRSPLEKAKERDDEWHKQVVDILEDPGEQESAARCGQEVLYSTYVCMYVRTYLHCRLTSLFTAWYFTLMASVK